MNPLRVGEVRRMPGEFAVACVPARRRELGAEIDQPVARQLLLAERLRDAENLLLAIEGPARLQVAEVPLRRHLRQPGDPRVFAHDHRGIGGGDDEDVERRLGVRPRRELADASGLSRSSGRPRRSAVGAKAGEVEGAVGLMDEHAPAVGADEPLHRRAGAVNREPVAVGVGVRLAVRHAIGRAFLVVLHAALAEAEQRALRQEEQHVGGRLVEGEALDGLALRGLDVQRRRSGGDADDDVAGTHAGVGAAASGRQRRPEGVLGERAREGHGGAGRGGRANRQPHGPRADGGHLDVGGDAGDGPERQSGSLADRQAVGDGQTRAGEAQVFQRVASCDLSRHVRI